MAMEEFSLSRQCRDFQEAVPIPLSQRGSQVSTLPSTLSRKTTDTSQIQSSLLGKLPAEVRILIWDYAIGRQEIHIISKYGRIGHAVCDAAYWSEHQMEGPGLRASSYMFTYGTLPRTRQLADWSMVNLLRTCRLIYIESTPILYTTNTFTFWDLRVVNIFKLGVPAARWESIRSITIYAAFYRHEDIPSACEARSILQFEAWPAVVSALQTLPNLRHLSIWIGNPIYLDQNYLNGHRTNLYAAVKAFLRELKDVSVNGKEVQVVLTKKRRVFEKRLWNTQSWEDNAVMRLEGELRDEGVDVSVIPGDREDGKETIERAGAIKPVVARRNFVLDAWGH